MEKIIKDRCATAYTGGMILQQCGAKNENFSRFFLFFAAPLAGQIRKGRIAYEKAGIIKKERHLS